MCSTSYSLQVALVSGLIILNKEKSEGKAKMKIGARCSPGPMLQGLPTPWPHPLIWHRKERVLSHQSRAALCEPMDCGPPGSSVHRILQARILGWAATPFSRGSSRPRDWTWVSHNPGRVFTIWAKIWHGRPSLTWLLLLFASTSLHVPPLTLVKTACFSPRTSTPCPPLCWHARFSLTFLSLATVTWLAPVCSSRLNPGVTVSRKFAFPLIPQALWPATHFGLPPPPVQTSTWTLSTVCAKSASSDLPHWRGAPQRQAGCLPLCVGTMPGTGLTTSLAPGKC